MSWWAGIPREQWSAAVAAQVERMTRTPTLRMTAQDVKGPTRKFEQGSTLIVLAAADNRDAA